MSRRGRNLTRQLPLLYYRSRSARYQQMRICCARGSENYPKLRDRALRRKGRRGFPARVQERGARGAIVLFNSALIPAGRGQG